MARKNTEKIDTWISIDLLKALENYMAINKRNKADAIRLLITQSLELEGHLFSLTDGNVKK